MSGEPGAQEGHVILLETARLRLRGFVQADVDQLVELDSDPEVMRHITYGIPTPRERYEFEILPRWLAFQDASPLLGYWVAELKGSSEFIGWFHLRPDRFDAGEQELGYRMKRSAWGRGYATEGGRALVTHGFERVGAGKISARTLEANLASRRVLEKCGLAYECGFVYPEDILAGRSEADRAAVKYSVTQSCWRARTA